MKIEDINAIELAGAVGHLAAGQFFGLLQDGACWISPEISADDGQAIEKAVLVLAEYVCTRELVPGQLMSFAAIDKIRDEDAELDVHRARAWAYDLFTVTARHAHMLTVDEQKNIEQDKAFEARLEAAQPLKLEDTIFEPHGSLGDMEDYQKQFLEDSEREQQRLLEEQQKAALFEVGDGLATSVGGAPETEPTMPAMKLGQTINTTGELEGGNEKETADPGQEAGAPTPAASEASDTVRADRDDGSPEADPEGLPAGDVPAPGEAGEATPVPGDDAPGEVTTTATGGKKPAKRKAAN
jgi:hypothetical protein